MRPQLCSDQDGFTVIELGMAMLITSLVAALMVSWILGVGGADERQRSNDDALGDLRDVTDQLGRDIRSAEHLTEAAPSRLTLWLDQNSNGVLDVGETVSWEIDNSGTVTRGTDAGGLSVVATRLDPAASLLSYDAAVPADVALVSIELVVASPSGGGFDRLRVATDVYLRNS